MTPGHPSPEDLALLDPDGSFVRRLAGDREAIAEFVMSGHLAGAVPIIHRLAGAAGTFGFDAIGELAISLDDIAVEGGALPPQLVDDLLDALDAAVKNARESA